MFLLSSHKSLLASVSLSESPNEPEEIDSSDTIGALACPVLDSLGGEMSLPPRSPLDRLLASGDPNSILQGILFPEDC